MPELTNSDDVIKLLSEAKTIAVVGIHDDLRRPAGYVPEYLAANGYRILGVNPRKVGLTLYGEPVRATLSEIEQASDGASDSRIDIVDMFRRSEDLGEHLADILAMNPRPRTVWFQLGIRNDEVAQALTEAGIDVVQDRCTLAEHKRFGIGSRLES